MGKYTEGIHLSWRVFTGGTFLLYFKFFKSAPKGDPQRFRKPLTPEHKLWFASSICLPILYSAAGWTKKLSEIANGLILLTTQIMYFATMYFYIKSTLGTLIQHFRLLSRDRTNTYSRERVRFFASKTLLIFFVDLAISIAWTQLVQWIWKDLGNSSSRNQDTIEERIKGQWLYVTISVLLFAPLFEELIYRRAMLKTASFHPSVILTSAFIFGMIHMDPARETVFHLIPYMLGGFVFAMSYKWFKNIWISIFVHFLHNLLALIIFFTKSETAVTKAAQAALLGFR
ncbi:membrane-bound, CAAX amino terminal protease [Candidatus Mycoplasma haematolamae str. Purdue]|uniref:Membrane-bound, CAAX amino terminal protease n=1 Tax=Mycoplasma haematolamae (strain Purdue) TaxID=1212765 RepID=I7CIL3_MYCHA|nr:CPBP family intramembrane glutamic endopeptidase [Candidatus Mycoplasma haematolamae]AFO51714.1 membrane-bound, CAAX amino terminal protease [Candidatus Mycoplasma haematolamae str. Purdue]